MKRADPHQGVTKSHAPRARARSIGILRRTTTSRSSFGTCRRRARIFCTWRCGARRGPRITLAVAPLALLARLCRAPSLSSPASGCALLWGRRGIRRQQLSYLAARAPRPLGGARLSSAIPLALGRTPSPPAAVAVVGHSAIAATQAAVRVETPRAVARPREALTGPWEAVTLEGGVAAPHIPLITAGAGAATAEAAAGIVATLGYMRAAAAAPSQRAFSACTSPMQCSGTFS